MKLAVAQFAPKNGDKEYNLAVMQKLLEASRIQGAKAIVFHEMCITAYTFLKDLSKTQMMALAEPDDGPSVKRLQTLSVQSQMAVFAGFLEEDQGKFYNTYVGVSEGKVIAKFRKLHPFISPFLSAGDKYEVFDLFGWKCGILICYDNNVIENVRATTLLGAELIIAPHVTGCTPSAMPGRGFVSDDLWQNRKADPDTLRRELDGPKGRQWLMRWLPARAYDNGVYYAFANPIGYDGEHLKNGNSMILDPYGEVLCETRSFEAEIAITELTKDKLSLAGGFRYRNARRPELYREVLGASHDAHLKPIWMNERNKRTESD